MCLFDIIGEEWLYEKEETDTFSLRIPISMKLRLSMIANQENRTINSLVNQILKEYIDTDNAKK